MLASPFKPVFTSLVLGLAFVGAIASVASFTSFTAIGALLLPGMLVAALAVPEGVHSSAFVFYFGLAGFTNVLLYSVLPWLIIRRRT